MNIAMNRIMKEFKEVVSNESVRINKNNLFEKSLFYF
jgi:ubiquitin-protein ligase